MNPASTAPGTRPRPGCPASSSPRHPLRRGVRPLHPGRARPLAPRPPRLGGHHVDAWAAGQPDGARDAVRVDRRGLGGDLYGRRLPMAVSLAVLSLSMLLSAVAGDLTLFAATPFLTGMGTGALIPLVTAYVSEAAAPARHSLQGGAAETGIALGGIIAGVVGSTLLPSWDFHTLFHFGVVPLLLVPVVWRLVPATLPGAGRRPPRRAEGAAEPAPGASAGRLRALAPGPPPHHPALLGRHLRRTRHRLRRQHLAAHPDGRLRLRPQLLAGVLHRLERGRRPRHPGRRRRRRRRRPGLPQGRHPHQLPLRHRRDDHPQPPQPGPYCCSPPPSSAAAPSVPRPWSTSTSLTRTLPRCAAPRSASAWGWAGSAPSPAPATCRRSPSWSPRRRQASTRLWSRPSSARSSPACSGRVRAAPGRLGPTRRTPR